MAIQGIGYDDWQAWAQNPITLAYFKELADRESYITDRILKISSEKEISRNFFERKGEVIGLNFAQEHIGAVLEESIQSEEVSELEIE